MLICNTKHTLLNFLSVFLFGRYKQNHFNIYPKKRIPNTGKNAFKGSWENYSNYIIGFGLLSQYGMVHFKAIGVVHFMAITWESFCEQKVMDITLCGLLIFDTVAVKPYIYPHLFASWSFWKSWWTPAATVILYPWQLNYDTIIIIISNLKASCKDNEEKSPCRLQNGRSKSWN